MLFFINHANYVSFEHEFIDEIAMSMEDKVVLRYLVSWHQAGCDLYMAQVEFFLSLVDTFTYEDLKKLCNTSLISYQWQEEFWRVLVSQREENRKKPLPDKYWVVENGQQPRFAYYQRIGGSGKKSTPPKDSI